MIKRRKFIENAVSTMALLGISSPMSFGDLFQGKMATNTCPEDIRKACRSYFDKIFLMQNVDLNSLPSKGLIILSDSYEIKVNEEKNSVLDVAEDVIKETQRYGFNTESLREGKMPEGLTVYSHSILFMSNGKYKSTKIPGLRAYDVEILYKKPVTINYRVPVVELIKESGFVHLGTDDKYARYQGKNTKMRMFISLHDISRYFNIDTIEPLKIRSADDLNQPAFSKKAFSLFITDNFSKLIFS
jgi:hypothetical protein